MEDVSKQIFIRAPARDMLPSHRRTSLSSDSTVSSTEHSTATGSTLSNDEQDKFLALILALDQTLHPFSCLTHLAQVGMLSNLTCSDLGSPKPLLWRAQVRVHCQYVGWFSKESSAGSKMTAKKLAAAQVLQDIRNGMAGNSPFPDVTQDLLTRSFDKVLQSHTCPEAPLCGSPYPFDDRSVSAPKARTAGQTRVLSVAQEHLDLLHYIARERSVGASGLTLLSISAQRNLFGTQSELLEVGLAWVQASESLFIPDYKCIHLIVEEHIGIRNRLRRCDGRDELDLRLYETVSERMLAFRVNEIVDSFVTSDESVVLVGHTVENDVHRLRQIGVTRNWRSCDLAKAHQARQNTIQLSSLGNIMDALHVDNRNLYIDGNDAFRTLQVCVEMLHLIDEQHRNTREAATSLL